MAHHKAASEAFGRGDTDAYREHSQLKSQHDRAATYHQEEERTATRNEGGGGSDQSLRIKVKPGAGGEADSAILGGSDDPDLKVHPSHDQPRHPSGLFQGRTKNAASRGHEGLVTGEHASFNAQPDAETYATKDQRAKAAARNLHEEAVRRSETARGESDPKRAILAHREAAKVHGEAANAYNAVGQEHVARDHETSALKHRAAADTLRKSVMNPSILGNQNVQNVVTPGLWPGTERGSGPHGSFEDPSEELDEQDAAAELVGRQVTPDGRIIEPVVKTRQAGFAALGDEDGHDPGSVFDLETKSSKKVGPGQHVVVGNQGVLDSQLLLPVTNADGTSSFIINPAVSESQRRYLYWAFGPEWAKEHGFDNKGSLPEKVGEEKEDNQASSATLNDDIGTSPAQPGGQAMNDSHQASKQAAAASLTTEHDKAFGHAKDALACSKDGDCEGAAEKHEKAAKAHEAAETKARKEGKDRKSVV